MSNSNSTLNTAAPWMDTSLPPSERAALLLAHMDVAEKMTQIQCVFPLHPTTDTDELDAFPLGVGHVSALELRQATSLEEAAACQRAYQQRIMADSPHHVPAVFHMEAICGPYLTGGVSLPSGIARGAGMDPALEEELGRVVGHQERAAGLTYALAPVLDVARDPRMGRFYESYGEDPTVVGTLGAAFTRGLQADDAATPTAGSAPAAAGPRRRTECVAKHFMGFHAGEGGIHGTHALVPRRLLREVYGKPFQAAISEAGLHHVMPCYNSIDGEVTSGSRWLLTDLLRDAMGLDGTAVSDYGAVANLHRFQHMAASYTDAGVAALSAGMDAEWQSPMCFNDELRRRFEDGELDTGVLDRAVIRVLETKFRMGLFEDPLACEGADLHRSFEVGRAAALTLASARQSIVLLRNDGTLPLATQGPKAPRRVVVIGPHAVNARFFFGGYTHVSMLESLRATASSMAGLNTSRDEIVTDYDAVPGTQVQADDAPQFDAVLTQVKLGTPTLLEELRRRLPEAEVSWVRGYEIAGDSREDWDEALAAAQRADLVVLTLGGKCSMGSIATMGEGIDSTDINLPATQEGLLRQIVELGVPAVGVHVGGRPVSSDAADRLPALVEAWNPAEAGAQAIVDVLTGVVDASGRLPVSVARSAGQVPVYYNHPYGSQWHQAGSIGFPEYVDMPHTPRYPFGFGMSYTTFAYSSLEGEAASIGEDGVPQVGPDGALTAAVTVTNTGERPGTEVVQLYASDRYASTVRPVQELIGFQRVELGAGESAVVSFEISPSVLAFLDKEMHWVVEAGDVDVRVGSSSEDVRGEATFRVIATAVVDERTRAFRAPSEVSRSMTQPG